MNRAKEKLAGGGTVLVFNPNFPSPALVEYIGGLGFDVAFIDCEHGTADFERVEELARAARAGGITSILRPWSAEPGLITRFLDCGVGGIQFPHIEDRAIAAAAVDLVREARGSRVAETLVTAMIESVRAVENIDEIVSVEGIDAVVVGAADLARSLGHPGELNHPSMLAAVDKVIRGACRSGRAAAGFNLHQWERGPDLARKGVRWFNVHARTMLARGSAQVQELVNRR